MDMMPENLIRYFFIRKSMKNVATFEKEVLLKKVLLLSRLNWIVLNHVCYIIISLNDKLIKNNLTPKRRSCTAFFLLHQTRQRNTYDPDKV